MLTLVVNQYSQGFIRLRDFYLGIKDYCFGLTGDKYILQLVKSGDSIQIAYYLLVGNILGGACGIGCD